MGQHDVPCAATAADRHCNKNLDELRAAMERHMIAAPRRVPQAYVLRQMDRLDARREGWDPAMPPVAWVGARHGTQQAQQEQKKR
jgi:hypothetical protein